MCSFVPLQFLFPFFFLFPLYLNFTSAGRTQYIHTSNKRLYKANSKNQQHIRDEDQQKRDTYLIMATYVLPTTVYQPPPQVRREARVTLIEDELQINIPPYHYPSKLMITSPMSDDMPTPRGLAATITPATDATSVVSSMWSHRSSNSSFDSLYDLTDSEGEEVPLKLSASVKKHVVDKERSRYPLSCHTFS